MTDSLTGSPSSPWAPGEPASPFSNIVRKSVLNKGFDVHCLAYWSTQRSLGSTWSNIAIWSLVKKDSNDFSHTLLCYLVIVLLCQKVSSIAVGINGNIYEHSATYKDKTMSVAIWTTISSRYGKHVFVWCVICSLSALLVQQVPFVQLVPVHHNLWDSGIIRTFSIYTGNPSGPSWLFSPFGPGSPWVLWCSYVIHQVLNCTYSYSIWSNGAHESSPSFLPRCSLISMGSLRPRFTLYSFKQQQFWTHSQ